MKKWGRLPENLQQPEIKPYYDELKKKSVSIFWKRVFDIVFGVILFLVLLPFMILIGLCVLVTSPGGMMFCQERVTTYGRRFRIYKFRTMVADAEAKGTLVTTKGDARVTGVGRFLRKVRLDELPQIINIIKGDMSFVGTRPEVPRYVEKYTPEMLATLLMPAGVTSQASIAYKDEEKLLSAAEDADAVYVEQVLPEKMKYNLEYLRGYSLGKDLKCMIQTVIAVLH